MIKIQLIDNGKYKRYYSTSGMMIQKVGTDELYRQAVDIATSTDRYQETDIPIPRGHPNDIFKESVAAILNGAYQLVHLPNAELFNTLKQRVMDAINAETENNIRDTFYWRGMKLWLSDETQGNLRDIYTASKDAPKMFPVAWKFGTDEEPIIVELTPADVQDLYTQFCLHRQACTVEGWQRKYSIDWELIERGLEELKA